MKFTQIAIGKFRIKERGGYTLFALGEDGVVYKSIHPYRGFKAKGWLPMPDMVLTEEDVTRESRVEGQIAHAAGQLETQQVAG
jgi:hypothetical protein